MWVDEAKVWGGPANRHTYLLRYSDANLVEDLFEYLVAFLLLVFEVIVHDVVDGVAHHLLFHVHRRALALKIVHDALDLWKVESPVHALHRLSELRSDHQH